MKYASDPEVKTHLSRGKAAKILGATVQCIYSALTSYLSLPGLSLSLARRGKEIPALLRRDPNLRLNKNAKILLSPLRCCR